MPQSTSETVFAVSVLSVDVLVFGTAILLSAFGTSEFMFAVSACSILIVAFGVVVLLLALGVREREDVAKRRLLTKTGLVLCGLMTIATPFSVHMYWKSTSLSPLDWRFWSSQFWMGWPHLLSLALFAAIGGFVIEQARSSMCREGVHSKSRSTLEVVFTGSLMSLLTVGSGAAILLSADYLNFMRAVNVLGHLLVGFGIAVLLLAFGYRERADVVKRGQLTKAALLLCGLMIIAAPLSLYMFWTLPIYPDLPWNITVYLVFAAPMIWYNILILTLSAALGGAIIQRAWSTQQEAKPLIPTG